MIKTLRKRHLQIWTLLAVLLPAGIAIAWLSIPKAAKDKLLQPASIQALPNILASAEKDDYLVRIRSNSDTSRLQIEWINKKTLTYPTAAVYVTTNNINEIEKASLAGRIEARGTYYFLLASTKDQIQIFNPKGLHLLLYDFIHKKIIDTINF